MNPSPRYGAGADCLPERKVNVRNHFFFPNIRSHVDIVKEDGEITAEFPALRKPFFKKINSGLVVIARANVPGEGAPVARNYFVGDT
jgi:hypothetical protein